MRGTALYRTCTDFTGHPKLPRSPSCHPKLPRSPCWTRWNIIPAALVQNPYPSIWWQSVWERRNNNHQLNILAAMPGAPLPNRCLLHHGRHGLVPRKGVQGHHSQDKARGQSKPHGLTLHGETSQYVMHVLYVMYVMYQSLPELRTDVNK